MAKFALKWDSRLRKSPEYRGETARRPWRALISEAEVIGKVHQDVSDKLHSEVLTGIQK